MRTWTFAVMAAAIMALAGADRGLAQTKVVYGYNPTFDMAPVLIAMDKGFFRKHGVDVTLKPVPLNSYHPAALEAGETHIGMPTASVLLQAVDGGLDLVAVSGYGVTEKDDTNYAIVTRPGSGIARPADFAGRKVGVPGLNAFLHVLFREWLTMKGVDWKKVEFVEVQFPLMEGVLKSGSVDAVVVIQPFLARIVDSRAGHLHAHFIQDFPPDINGAVFASKRNWAIQNVEAIKGWRAALDEAGAYALANPEETRTIAASFLKLPPQALAAVKIPVWSSKLTVTGMAPWVSIMKSQGMIKRDIKIDGLIVP
jgi:NitT/TauT family transport system substrate-binding protein